MRYVLWFRMCPRDICVSLCVSYACLYMHVPPLQPIPSPDKKTSMTPVTSTLSEMKVSKQLRNRIMELEMQNMSLEAEKTVLHETIASQTKTISGLHTQIKSMESDVDRLKTAFSQSSTNVNIWKDQLQSYQNVNDLLTNKIAELSSLHEQFGDILRQSQMDGAE